jgi:hypothetical protein
MNNLPEKMAEKFQPRDQLIKLIEVFEIAAAPKNRPIIGIYPDGSEDLIEWVEDAKCMMAGIAGGYGYFGEGWQSVDVNLIVDTPKYWREA